MAKITKKEEGKQLNAENFGYLENSQKFKKNNKQESIVL